MTFKKSLQRFFNQTVPGLFIYVLVMRFFEEGCTYRSASLVYTTLIGLIPFIFISITMLSMLPGYSNIHDPFLPWLSKLLTTSQLAEFNAFVNEFMVRVKKLSVFNVTFLLIACVLMINNMAAALNDIWDMHKKRAWWVSLIVYIAVVIIGPLSMGGVTIIWAIMKHWPYISMFNDLTWLSDITDTIIPYIILGGLLSITNVVLPAGKVPWLPAIIGSACTIVLFILIKWIFVSVIMNRPTYHILYGNLAVFPLLMIWLYLIWVVVLVGALIGYNIANGLSLSSLKQLAKES